MAKAMQFKEYGAPDVLELTEVPDPVAERGQVRIRVKAAGVQPFDCATRRGDYAAYNQLSFPVQLGNEVAGVIDQVGAGSDFAVGDEVIAFMTMGGYADTVVVPVDQVGLKPESMSWREAGVLTASGQTAYTALDELAITEDDTLLIHAAAGGVGSFAVQLAKIRGATVIGTASERNHDYLRSLGALPVAYGTGLADRVRAVAPKGVDAALDAVGGEALDVSVDLTGGKTARIVSIIDWANSARLGVRLISTDRSTQKLNELIRLYGEGRLRIEVAKTFPLDHAADAHREVETGHVRGKVALVVT